MVNSVTVLEAARQMTVVIHIFPNPPSTRELHPPFQLLPFASLRDFAWTLIVATGCVSARCRRHGLRRCFSLADTKFVHTCGRQSRPVFFVFFFAGADWKSPTGIALPHLFLQLIFIPNSLFLSLLFASRLSLNPTLACTFFFPPFIVSEIRPC